MAVCQHSYCHSSLLTLINKKEGCHHARVPNIHSVKTCHIPGQYICLMPQTCLHRLCHLQRPGPLSHIGQDTPLLVVPMLVGPRDSMSAGVLRCSTSCTLVACCFSHPLVNCSVRASSNSVPIRVLERLATSSFRTACVYKPRVQNQEGPGHNRNK